MITYKYKCWDCGFIEEHRHGMEEDPKILCKKCNAVMEILIGKVYFTMPVEINLDTGEIID